MIRLSTLYLQPIVNRLQEAATTMNGETYWQNWKALYDCYELANQRNQVTISRWILKKLDETYIPNWNHLPDANKEKNLPKLLSFYECLLPTLSVNDRHLFTIVGLDPELDERAFLKVDLTSTMNTSETASLFKAFFKFFSPEERSQYLLQLIDDVKVEAELMPLEYNEDNPSEARKSRAAQSMRTVFQWLMQVQPDAFHNIQKLCEPIISLYEKHLPDHFHNISNRNFDHLCLLGMKPLARKMLVRQQAHKIEVRQVLGQLDNPQPDELFACIMKEAISGEGIDDAFGQLFNHPDRAAVKAELDRLRLKGTGLQVRMGKSSSFEKMAWQCAAWAKNAPLNAAEREAMDWWARGMLERLKAEKQMNVERNTKTLSGLLSDAGMSIEKQLSINSIHKISRFFLEKDLSL
jgi:hypothetical protein